MINNIVNNVFLLIAIGLLTSCSRVEPTPGIEESQKLSVSKIIHREQTLKNGYVEEFWPNGNLLAVGYYKDGKAHGWMKWHNEQGVLVAEGEMINNKRNGPWKICDLEITTDCIQANFNMEVREGLWKVNYENGELRSTQTWKEDQMVAQTCWDEKGKEVKCE